jgi:co-chaperonin GroES (HSP10)
MKLKQIKLPMTLSAPFNNLLVKIETKFIQEVTHAIRMANLNHGTQINPADYVSITGEIVSLPKKIMDRYDYNGFSLKDIRIGDIAIFSYAIIFTFVEKADGEATYKNMFYYAGNEYWKVDIQNLYGVIRNGKIIMVNGYCMVEQMSQPSMIILPASEKRKIRASTATLTQIGNNLEGEKTISAYPGDKVHYNPNKLIEYSIGEKKFGILRQKDIAGVEIGGYSHLVAK